MNHPSIQFIIGAALVFLGATASRLEAVTIGTLKDFPAGSIRYSMQEENAVHFFEVNWGGDKEDTGKGGPVIKIGQSGAEMPKVAKISERAVEQLFATATKLTVGYALPRSSTGEPSKRDGFQLDIGVIYDPVKLSFPRNEPALWKRGANCWSQFAEILNKEASLVLPKSKPVQVDDKAAPKPGLASIVDYTSLKLTAERVHRSKTDYGMILAEWNRSADGTITFNARYLNRAGDTLRATLTPAQIRPIFDELQKLTNGYHHPSFARNKSGASRDYDSISLGINASGQPGEFLLPYFSTAQSQWGDADHFWSLLVQLFPKEQQATIIQ